MVDALFDSLTRWDDELATGPAAAARWTTPDEGRTWVFTLAGGATFHDGTPVTAAAFVTGWNALASGAAHRHLRDVEGYEAVRSGRARTLAGLSADGNILTVRLQRPSMEFPTVAGHPALAPLPATRDQALQAFANRPIGNGPFRMAEPWARGRFVRLARVDVPAQQEGTAEYAPDEILFTVADAETAYLAFSQGRLDVVTIPPDAIGRALETLPRASGRRRGPGFLHGDAAATTVLVTDTSRPPFDRVAVRRALSLALRRDDLAVPSLSGGAEPALSLAPPSIPGARIRTCTACRYDPETARATLRRMRLGPVPLTFPEGVGQERLAARIQEQLAEVGVRVRLRPVPFESYAAALQRGGAGLSRLAWTLDYPTLDNALRPLLSSDEVPPLGANYARYQNPAVDRLLERARRTASTEERTALYRVVEDLAMDAMAVIPILTHRQRLAVGDRVRGLTWTAMGSVDLEPVRLRAAAPE